MSGRFAEGFVDEVLARTSLVDLVGREVTLKRKGKRHWGLCPFHADKKTPSFTVEEGRGSYKCYGCGRRGDAIDWLQERSGLGFVEAVEELAVRAGMMPDREGRTRPVAKPVAQRQSRAEIDAETADKVAWARSLWAGCRPAAGTLVETYLAARGIDVGVIGGVPPTIRFHPALKHRDTGLYLPAMVAAVQAPDGRIAGIHRTFLRMDGAGKAGVVSPKKMGGVCWGGVIRLCSAAGRMGVAEGIETALSVMTVSGLPVWAAGSLGNMAAADLPPMVREVVLCTDGDSDPGAVGKAVAKANEFHAARGRTVREARAPAGTDWNDLLTGPDDG